jgi:hypothetical protein
MLKFKYFQNQIHFTKMVDAAYEFDTIDIIRY